MSTSPKGTIGISDLIARLKKDLLSKKEPTGPELFSIDEITIEINFTVDGDIESGFNFGVVTLGSQVSEERVQKVTVKMSPIVSKKQLINNLNSNPDNVAEIMDATNEALLRGGNL